MKINEIFLSLQGEGHFSGTPAVFIRFSGCNLRCPFCDTQHESGKEMTEEEIVTQVASFSAKHVVVTGGEPALFLTETLVDALHAAHKIVAVETNGTRLLPKNVDWITLSPKFAFFKKSDQGTSDSPVISVVSSTPSSTISSIPVVSSAVSSASNVPTTVHAVASDASDAVLIASKTSFAAVVLPRCDELKAVFTSAADFAAVEKEYLAIPATFRYVQPCDTGEPELNRRITEEAVRWCQNHPYWSLSVQLHKLLGLP